MSTLSLAFSLIGGPHHFLHIVPVAAELSHDPEIAVTAYVCTAAHAQHLQNLLAELGAGPVAIVEMTLPRWFERLATRISGSVELKVPRLLWWIRRLRAADAVMTAERTSALLKTLPGRCPPLILLPHGFGDRARGFERRHIYFDHIIVAGPGIRARMIESGITSAEKVSVAGAIKIASLRRMRSANRKRLFSNDRPIILYNAHFDHDLGSWRHAAADLIEAVAIDGRFNLIVAPHIRMFEGATLEEKARWNEKAIPDRIIVDLDSERLSDMTYTFAADIYVGDVSSQVYEFLVDPKPCVFIDAHGVDWKGSQDYANWRLGEVRRSVPEIMDALAHAHERHSSYVELQRKAVGETLGDVGNDAPAVAAGQLLKAIGYRAQPSVSAVANSMSLRKSTSPHSSP